MGYAGEANLFNEGSDFFTSRAGRNNWIPGVLTVRWNVSNDQPDTGERLSFMNWYEIIKLTCKAIIAAV